MRTAIKNVFLAASLAALSIPVIAQAIGAAAGPKSRAHKPDVQQRKKHPPKRIAQGLESRKQAASEAGGLERKKNGINSEDRNIRNNNRGPLPSANRARLQHQQNRLSKAIDHKKHKAVIASAHARSTAGPPKQHRTAQLKTGQLTTRQAAHFKTKEALLQDQTQSDRERNGKSTESADSNHPPNKTTPEIHLKAHNARMF